MGGLMRNVEGSVPMRENLRLFLDGDEGLSPGWARVCPLEEEEGLRGLSP